MDAGFGLDQDVFGPQFLDLIDLWHPADPSTLPVGWNAEPAGLESIRYGSAWVAGMGSALLLVPSVIVPEERNALINPLHPDAARVKARKVRRWLYAPRLGRGSTP
ncbi:RES family NAD+ phosphorylase [Bosea sp. LjRoot9]|uniref:RES family NAD+ phosphorylase n=1 Tax=Bosea sp. LjRoot9 TaxID=3342341 RepID=UPI003F4F7821